MIWRELPTKAKVLADSLPEVGEMPPVVRFPSVRACSSALTPKLRSSVRSTSKIRASMMAWRGSTSIFLMVSEM